MVTGPWPCHSASCGGLVVHRTSIEYSSGSSWSEHTATDGPVMPASCHAAEARALLGVGDAQNRTRLAVERTVLFGLYCYTITVIWYVLHGHHPADAADHRERAPWYTTKTDPSLSDMAAKLRRTIIAARFLPTHPGQPTHAEIRAVQQAWATASSDYAACHPVTASTSKVESPLNRHA